MQVPQKITIQVLDEREQIKLMRRIIQVIKSKPEEFAGKGRKIAWEKFFAAMREEYSGDGIDYDDPTLRHYLQLCNTWEYFVGFQMDDEGFSFQRFSAQDNLWGDQLQILKFVPPYLYQILALFGAVAVIRLTIPVFWNSEGSVDLLVDHADREPHGVAVSDPQSDARCPRPNASGGGFLRSVSPLTRHPHKKIVSFYNSSCVSRLFLIYWTQVSF